MLSCLATPLAANESRSRYRSECTYCDYAGLPWLCNFDVAIALLDQVSEVLRVMRCSCQYVLIVAWACCATLQSTEHIGLHAAMIETARSKKRGAAARKGHSRIKSPQRRSPCMLRRTGRVRPGRRIYVLDLFEYKNSSFQLNARWCRPSAGCLGQLCVAVLSTAQHGNPRTCTTTCWALNSI